MRLGVITDEISEDLDHALGVCGELGVSMVELRSVGDANVVFHEDRSLARIKAALDAGGFQVCAIASPFLKTHLREASDQWGVLERSFELARLFGAPLVRAFSFWRVQRPIEVREEVAGVLREAARRTEAAGLSLVLENEHECNVATGEETGWVLERVPSPSFGVTWDPGNEARIGSSPFPEGYSHVKERVMHVHLKDADARGRWVRMGSGVIDYVGQLRALSESGYEGVLSLETHYGRPGSGLEGATRESLAGVRRLCREAGVRLKG
jgi:sugar phosphate isomerase/epimerase